MCKSKKRLDVVGGVSDDPAPTTEPDVRVSSHPAPECMSCCHQYHSDENCGLAGALSELNIHGMFRLHYVRDVCHKTLALRVPRLSHTPAPRQPISGIAQSLCFWGHPIS